MALSEIRELLELPTKVSAFFFFREKGRFKTEIDSKDEDKYFATQIYF
jgi:hypothetical protein